jgi:predicted secreted protein
MSSAVSGYGTQLVWNSQDVAEVTNLTGPNESRDMIDVTNHDSSDAFREFIAGLADAGEIGVEGNFKASDADGQIAMHTDFQGGTSRSWQLTFPSSLGNMAGNGLCSAFSLGYPHDGKIPFTATIKVTGKPTLTIS